VVQKSDKTLPGSRRGKGKTLTQQRKTKLKRKRKEEFRSKGSRRGVEKSRRSNMTAYQVHAEGERLSYVHGKSSQELLFRGNELEREKTREGRREQRHWMGNEKREQIDALLEGGLGVWVKEERGRIEK